MSVKFIGFAGFFKAQLNVTNTADKETKMDIRKIESRDNPHVKLARKVRDGNEREMIFVEGTRLSEEAVRSGAAIEFCLLEDGYEDNASNAALVDSVSRKTDEVFSISERLFSSVSDTKTSQGIALICRRPQTDRQRFEQSIANRTDCLPMIIMLSDINNPSNLGAVVRTAEAASVKGIIIGKDSADVFSAKALRGAMGSTFRVPIWTAADAANALEWARSSGYSIVGTSAGTGQAYTDLDWTQARLLVIGSEAHGLCLDLKRKLDETVSIPMHGVVESLNLAVATAVILFEARRQVCVSTGG